MLDINSEFLYCDGCDELILVPVKVDHTNCKLCEADLQIHRLDEIVYTEIESEKHQASAASEN